jgi:hypothetical protein
MHKSRVVTRANYSWESQRKCNYLLFNERGFEVRGKCPQGFSRSGFLAVMKISCVDENPLRYHSFISHLTFLDTYLASFQTS